MDWDGNFSYKGRIDVAALKARVLEQSDNDWNLDAHRQTTFAPHRHTQTIPLLYDADFRHTDPTAQPKFAAFESALQPIFGHLAKVYGADGKGVRCILTRLAAGLRIPRHVDQGFSLHHSHRVHIPVLTNDSVFFTVGGEEIAMKEGEVWEINNTRAHAVRNDSGAARVHLIIDWAPGMTVMERGIYELTRRELTRRTARGDAGDPS